MTRFRAALHAAGWALALVLGTAAAQLRTLPPEAQRGWIRHQQDMTVTLSGRPMRLAPGAQIRDAANRIVLPAALPADALVKFTVDPAGHVNRVWILTDAEAAQPDPRR